MTENEVYAKLHRDSVLREVEAFLVDFIAADLDEGAADAVTVGMVFQQQASCVVLPRIRALMR